MREPEGPVPSSQPETPTERLRELAVIGANEEHFRGYDRGNVSGHTEMRPDRCQHSDCVLVRSALPVVQDEAPKARYGCHECGQDFAHEPFQGTVVGFNDRRFFFCSSLCRVAWASKPLVQGAALGASRPSPADPLLQIAGLVNSYHNDGTTLSAAETLKAIADVLGDPFQERPSPATPFEACDESKATLSDTVQTMRLTAETFGPEAETQILRWADEIEAAITDPDVGPSPAPKETKS